MSEQTPLANTMAQQLGITGQPPGVTVTTKKYITAPTEVNEMPTMKQTPGPLLPGYMNSTIVTAKRTAQQITAYTSATQRIGNSLKLLRKGQKTTQRGLAHKIGMSASTISYAERGWTSSIHTYNRIAEGLGWSLDLVSKAPTTNKTTGINKP